MPSRKPHVALFGAAARAAAQAAYDRSLTPSPPPMTNYNPHNRRYCVETMRDGRWVHLLYTDDFNKAQQGALAKAAELGAKCSISEWHDGLWSLEVYVKKHIATTFYPPNLDADNPSHHQPS